MLNAEQIVEMLSSGKLDISDKHYSKIQINKYYDQLIEDTDYINQMIVQAHNATSTPEQAVNYILTDYIRLNTQIEYGEIMEELNNGVRIEFAEK